MGASARRFLTLLLVSAAVGLFAFSAVAGAEEYPPEKPEEGTLIVPDTVRVGGEAAVSGTGCGPNQTVTITFNGAVVATATTDAEGKFSASFKVPADTAPGVYSVVAYNDACVLSNVIDVEAAAALAFTGSSSTVPTVWIALGLVALGSGLVFVARRRLSRSHIH